MAMIAIPAAAQDGDARARGEQLYAWCSACHSLTPGEDDLQGPNLFGIVGSRAGERPGFPYSDALVQLREDGVVWTPEAFDAFLADPLEFAPDNAMSFFGMDDPAERADLIAYLQAVAEDREQ